MPRPKIRRKVCCLPRINEFNPVGGNIHPREVVIISVDEYETIRLIDNEGMSQAECSGYMNIARTTVQQIYDRARKKVARALVEGLPIRIEGGEYLLCNGTGEYCGHGGCCRHHHGNIHRKTNEETT